MNNKTRLKTYGILMALILVVVGVVWFYQRDHSSKLPHTKSKITIRQEEPSFPKSETTTVGSDVPAQKPTFKYAAGAKPYLGTVKMVLARALKLNDSEVDRLIAVIDASRLRACELMANHATITEASATIVKMKTHVPDEQVERLAREAFSEMHEIVGTDRWKLLDDGLDNEIRSWAFGFGRGARSFTFVGTEPNWNKRELPNPPFPIATAPSIKVIQDIDFGELGILPSDGIFSYLNDYSYFRKSYGKIATMVFTLSKVQNMSSQ